jgi:hypothetical protein
VYPTSSPLRRFYGAIDKPKPTWFWGSNHQTVATGFEAQTEKPVTVVLMPNHWQTVDCGFEAQPRNMCFSSLCAWYRSHTTSPDLTIIWPPSTQPTQPSSVLCTRSPTHATILVAAHHAAPPTYTPRDMQTQFSKRNKDKGKTIKLSHTRIQTSPSQWLITIKWRNWPLDFPISPLTSLVITKAQSLEFEFKTSWSTTRRLEANKKLKKVI